jgi:hypothetical protein
VDWCERKRERPSSELRKEEGRNEKGMEGLNEKRNEGRIEYLVH